MAEEKSQQDDAGANLNEEAYSLFIFKIGPQSMRAAENYLKNRNWNIGSASGMREALAYIIQKKPQYVMVAADHPNKKVKIFPNLITQAFPVKVIAFSEGANTASMNSLREMGLPLTLFPPVSGPSIERLVRKINRDAKEETERQALLAKQMESGEVSVDGTGSAAADSTIRLKGESSTAEDMQKSFEQARQALMALADAGDDDASKAGGAAYIPNHGADASSTPTGAVTGQVGTSSPNLQAQQTGSDSAGYSGQQSGAAYREMGTQQSGNKSAAYTGSQGSSPSKGGLYNPQDGSKSNDGSNVPHPEASGWETPQARPSAPEAASENSPTKGAKGTQDAQGNAATSGANPAKTTNSNSEGTANSQSGANADENPKKAENKLYVKGVEKQLSDNDSLIIKGSVEALDTTSKEIKAVATADELSPATTQQSASNIHCITVDSPRFSGYLVAALGKNRSLDKTFIDTVKQRLYKFLVSNGEAVLDENAFDIKIKEVPFEDWAIQQAEFLRKSVHGGEEIAMAFFPNPNVNLKLEESENEKMVQISLDELAEDVALDFDLYIYMPENKKFLLYTPEGKPLYGKQKNRLKEKGLTHMHLRKDSINSVKKYRAQNYLNTKIDSFHGDPKNKKKD